MNEVKRKKKNKKGSAVFTRETIGVVLVLFCALCLVCLITREMVFSVPGQYINAFLLGVFGYFAFVLCVFGGFVGVLLIADKKTGLNATQKVLLTLAVLSLGLFLHALSMGGEIHSYGEYISQSYLMAEKGVTTASACGVLGSIIAFPFYALMTLIGSCVVTGVLTAVFVFFFVMNIRKAGNLKKTVPQKKLRSSYAPEKNEQAGNVEISGVKDYPVENVEFNERVNKQKLFVSNPQDFSQKTKKDMAKSESVSGIKLDFSPKGLGVGHTNTYSKDYANDMKSKLEYVKTPSKINLDGNISTYYSSIHVSNPINPVEPKKNVDILGVKGNQNQYGTGTQSVSPVRNGVSGRDGAIPLYEHDGNKAVLDNATEHSIRFTDKYARMEGSNFSQTEKTDGNALNASSVLGRNSINKDDIDGRIVDSSIVYKKPELSLDRTVERRGLTEIPTEKDNGTDNVIPEKKETRQGLFDKDAPPVSPIIGDRRASRILFGDNKKDEFDGEKAVGESERPSFTSRVSADRNESLTRNGFPSRNLEKNVEEQSKSSESEPPKKVVPPINMEYFRPPLDLLKTYAVSPDAPKENHEERMEIIQRTLEEFHINAVPQSYVQGPTITRYEMMMPAGISVKKVLNYDDDLRMRLSSRDGVRIEAPIPGKNLVGVEVANKVKVTVGLKEVIEGASGKKSKPSDLIFAIGKDIVGNSITDNLAKGPHFLVAGATGSGKSVCLNVMIISLIMRYSPQDLRLILVDPKRVGFRCYEHLPHLMIDEIITEPQKAVAILQWAYNEMERRYSLFEECGGLVSDIGAYNERIANAKIPKLARIVVVVDELADLMETCKKDLEAKIRALAAKARAAGIHLVLATQRPSVDVITGTIKANLPSRIALKVMNYVDSGTILSEGGAEKLLGNGDMLYKNSGMSECERYQGAWISDDEINNVVKYVIEHNPAYFNEELSGFLEKSMRPKQEETASVDGEGEDDGVNEFFLKALWLAVTSGTVSISQLQRRFQIGYARAGGLVDKMERMGFVGGNEGSKARRVILTREEFEEKFGPAPDVY